MDEQPWTRPDQVVTQPQEVPDQVISQPQEVLDLDTEEQARSCQSPGPDPSLPPAVGGDLDAAQEQPFAVSDMPPIEKGAEPIARQVPVAPSTIV